MLTQERLKELLSYDPETGIFKWVAALNWRIEIGRIAGTLHHTDYVYIEIAGKSYAAHRLAWLYIHGCWPVNKIDHRNRVRNDNRQENLREATNAQNAQNAPCRKNKSGYAGVHYTHGWFQARISVDGKRCNIGCYPTPELANAAYLAAKREFHPFSNI